MQLTRREKAFIGAFILVSVIAVYYVFLYQPLVRDIEAMSMQVAEIGDLPLLIKSKREQLASLQQEYEELLSYVLDTLENLRWPDDQPGLIVHLYEVFSSRSERQQIEFGEMEHHSDFCLMPVNVTFTATYDDFRDILVQLEKSPYRNHVQAFNIQAVEGGSAVSVNMSLRFYFKPEPSTEGMEYPFLQGSRYGKDNPFEFPGQ